MKNRANGGIKARAEDRAAGAGSARKRRMFRQRGIAAVLLAVVPLAWLTGCLYRGGREEPPEAAAVRSLPAVEQAVLAYRAAHGVLPILNSGPDTSLHEKYRIDFRLLKELGYVADIPSSAFENGGYYYFVIVEPEGDLAVKLLDLRVTQAAADLQREVDGHHARTGAWPFGEPMAPGFYGVDFAKLGTPARQAKSVYSSHYLPFLLHESGRVGVHYALDVMLFVERSGAAPEEGADLLPLLVQQSPFVPAASFPYRWIGGEPVPVGGADPHGSANGG